MCPATRWIVVAIGTLRSHVEIVDAFGFAASLPQKKSSAPGTTAASEPYLRPRSASAASRLHKRPFSPLTQASSTGAGSSTVSSESSPAGGASANTARERSGAPPFTRL